MPNKKDRILEVVLILFAFFVINVACQVFQSPTTYNNGLGWDGVSYFQVAKQIASGLSPDADAPFVYRVGTPFLVSFFGEGSLLLGFKVVNIIGNFFLVIFLIMWFRYFIDTWQIRVVLVILFMTHWLSPIRYIYFYPTYSDTWATLMLLLGLLSIKRFQSHNNSFCLFVVALVSFVGVFFREIMLVIPVAFLFLDKLTPQVLGGRKLTIYLKFLPLLSGIVGLWIVRVLAHQSNDYSFIQTTLYYAYNKPFLIYLQAYFIIYGLLIIIPLYFFRQSMGFLSENRFLFVYLIIFVFLAWIGGTDTERVLLWASPVIYLLIGIAVQKNIIILSSPFFYLPLIPAQILTHRLFWILPDYPNNFIAPFPFLTILGNEFQFIDLFSLNGSLKIQIVVFAEYIALSSLMIVWLKRLQIHLAK
jgi:hypothetical protein